MSKRMDVGRSWRTYAKHELMSSFVGQESGAGGRLPAIHSHVWLDKSAGDGVNADGTTWRSGCSPGILAYYASKAAKPVEIVLHEIQPATYERLLSSLAIHLPDLGYDKDGENCWRIGNRVALHAVNASGHTARIDHVRPTDALMVLNDPNAITEWAMRSTFAQEAHRRTPWFRSLSTMGCNPAGLKRLPLMADRSGDASPSPLAERIAWFRLVADLEHSLPGYRDLLLAAVERDDAQWAYLISTSAKPRWRSAAENVVKTAFKRVGRTVALAWYRVDLPRFEETKRVLFFTKNERKELGL